MALFTTSQDHHGFSVRTPALEFYFSRDHGGIQTLRRPGGPNLVGHGASRATVDLCVGRDAAWLAERTLVRYLSHSVDQRDDAVDILVVLGIGPLMVYDRYRVTGTLITRRITVENVSDDEIQLHRVRLAVPWVRLGDPEICRFEAPGNSVRPHVALSVAAAVRRDIPPRRFFAPGLRDGRAIEAAPLHGTGLIALHEPTIGETLLCWFAGDTEAAQPYIEGNNTAVTLTHEIELADWLRAGVALSGGTQYLNLTHDQWPAALRTYRASLAYAPHESLAPAAWVYDAALYEIHPSQFGGFRGLAGELGRLHLLGVNTLCLLPIWARERHWNQPWDETWPGSGNPYAILDFETLDPALGTTDDLRHLVTTAHRYGIRVLVDLPLIGCDAASHYLNEHPYWFCQDENGQMIHMSDDPSLCPFDWANEELQNHVLLHAVGLAQSYDLDGFRACVARRTPPNWARRLAHHASAGSLAVLRFLDRLRHELRSRKADAAIVLSSGGPLASASADLVIDEMPHLMYFHTALNRASPHELGEWLSDHLAALGPGAARACFVESHHTWRLNPLADGIRGSRISRALLAGMVLCGFVPLLRGDPEQDVHNDAFVGQLLRIRAAHPTLRTGSSCHSCIACDSPDVFAILRSSPTERIIGLVNFGPHRRTLTFNIRTAPLGAPNEHYGLIDLFGGELLDGGQIVITPDNQGVLRVTAEPFSPYCFLVQPALAPQSPRERHGNGHTVAAGTPAGEEQQPDIAVAQI